MRIHINRLGAADRARLVEHRLTVEELTELHGMLLRGQQARQRVLRRVAAFSLILDIALLLMTVFVAGPTPAVLFAGVVVTVIVLLCLACTWAVAIGVFAHQYNQAVEEGYPELLGRLRL